jgi:hypothetical protein
LTIKILYKYIEALNKKYLAAINNTFCPLLFGEILET